MQGNRSKRDTGPAPHRLARHCGTLSLAVLAGCADAAAAEIADRRAADAAERRSSFGVYEGYTRPSFETWIRRSLYVPVRDGVRLAVDVVRPAAGGRPAGEPRPAVVTLQRYGRAHVFPGRPGVATPVDTTHYVRELVRHGYVYVSVGLRGTGASFGSFPGVHSANEARDAYDICEWIADQEWSNGRIGLMGNSYRANAALMAMSAPHPAVKAVFPSMMDFDMYETARPGGVLLTGALGSWIGVTGVLDGVVDAPANTPFPEIPPVDDDTGGIMLAAARVEHATNVNVLEQSRARLYRDDYYYGPRMREEENVLAARLPAINEVGVPVYLWSGWQDIWPKQPFLWMANLTGPRRLAVGPWSHDPDERDGAGRLLAAEQARSRLQATELLRWFDYWLKGVENGVMDEPKYAYAVVKDPETWEWRFSDRWPVRDGISEKTLYLTLGQDRDTGLLSVMSPVKNDSTRRTFDIDFTATTGPTSRWIDATSFSAMSYPDLIQNAKKGLVYLGSPAEAPYDVVGHPIVTLYVTSNAPDADVYVYLEKIDADRGKASYLSEGVLRASHRTLGSPVWGHLDLPWPTHRRADVESTEALNATIAELKFDLMPVSTTMSAGDRLRLTITGADADNFERYMAAPDANLSIIQSRDFPSRLIIPVVSATSE